MSRRDTFSRNILALTRKRTLAGALKGWNVERLFDLSTNGNLEQSCELCGTPFKRGALVQYSPTTSVIAVGGTCLQTLLLRQFPDAREIQNRKRETTAILTRKYSSLVDPGNWTSWIVDNAPPKFAREVAELMSLGTVLSDAGLKRLIRFHDETRRYPRKALIEDSELYAAAFGIPELLTLDDARRLPKRSKEEASILAIVAAASNRMKEQLVAGMYIDDDRETAAWGRLDGLGQRTVAALAAILQRGDHRHQKDLEAMAGRWPIAGALRYPDFVWSPRIGLGFVHGGDDDDPPWTRVRVWKFAESNYTNERCDLNYMKLAGGAPESAVLELEKLAFYQPVSLKCAAR